MKIISLKNKFLLFIVLFVVQTSFAQLSKTHYIPPLTAAEIGNANPEDQYFYISTPSIKDVYVTIKRVGLSSTFDKTYVVSKANPQEIFIDTGYAQLFIPSYSTGQKFTGRGFIIEATDLVYVSVRMEAGGAQAGALVSKGLSALGTEFRVGSFTNENPQTNNYLNFVSVMATEDNTQVTFDNLPAGLIVKNYTGSFPINTNLNKGESFIVATNCSDSTVNKDGLIGALVKSDKPIVVNCGSANGSFHNGGGRDYGIDQIVGADKIGNEYIFVRGFGDNGWENVLIVAHENNTTIYVNGNTTAIATINAGSYYVIEGNEYSVDGNMYVETSKNVFAFQGVGGLGNNGTPAEANQGMFFVPPLNCETRGNVDNIAKIDRIGNEIYQGGVSIVTKVGATITINKTPISGTPSPVPGKTDYVTYKILGLSGDISVESDNELYCAYFNYNGSATSGSFYSGFPTAPEINFDADFITLGNCIPNITLEAANMGNFESIEWYYEKNSGSGFIATGIHSQTLTPTFPGLSPYSTGTYYLKGITCTGEEINSIEVPVSICPDDADNDGIIDNLDVDNDNDGILNCTESYGNQIINLSNILSGNLPVGGYTFTGEVKPIPTSGTSNSITGGATGEITTNVASKNGLVQSSVKYVLDFNKNLNIEVLSNSDLTDQDEFIIQVSNNKTITLLDPDDQLLIDTDFDEVYESGITQYSSFEIRFKIKGTSLTKGAATFKFVSNSIDFFSFKHSNLSETSSRSTSVKITATCVPIDSDLDLITDEFDYDSDNDGIPDRAEGTGKLITLSGTDSNNDGLDDIFNGLTSPIDTDLDGVFDYLDIDSDNDGIYDLEESGSGLADLDFNGIIDNVLSTIGKNGWDDTAETSPDSGVIQYTIANTDGDTLFNYIDSDSDGDNCSDVIEAGFTDANYDGYLGDTVPIVNTLGKVTNASDGYTTPNLDYITAGLITINIQPIDTEICELTSTKITIETNDIDSYQWQISTDGMNWNDLVDDIIYSNSTTNELTLSNIPLSFNNYKYRVVLAKAANTCGLISDEILLKVNPLPIVNVVSDLTECDNLTDGDDTNGKVQNFDLESQTATVLGSQLPAEYAVTYHLSQSDADAGIGALSSPYENTSNFQTIYVRVQNIASGCFVSNLTFNLIVNPLPTANTVSNLIECDNLTDGNDANGIAQNFDLDSQTSLILGSQLPSEFTVTYHASQTDADSGNGALSSPHTNNTNPQTIYIRLENNTTGCVNTHLTFELIVDALPIANTVSNLELCDNLDDGNDTNGVVQSFDLESQTNTILGTQSATEYTVTYHLSTTDAISGNNALSSPHSNILSPNTQTIFVRVLNIVTGCINTKLSYDLIVHPLPTVINSVTLEQCDNDIDGFSLFNLTEANNEISTNASNENFTYYLSLSDALARTNNITNPTTFENRTVNADIVWASIQSKFGCTRVAEIQLFVSTTAIPSSFHRDFYQCDDYLDITNDNRDGIANFDFSSVDGEIKAIFPVGQKIFITYYRNESDALAEENAIPNISNYRNVGYPNSQDIYVRVDSEIDNDCLGFGDHITLTVEALPIANLVTINRQCDDDDDGRFPFDTSLIEQTVVGGQSNVTVSYFDELGNSLPSPLPNPFLTNSQTINIRVTNSATQAPDGPCYDETYLTFTVDTAPVAYAVNLTPVCDDESNDGVFNFDTSTVQSTILGGQIGMEVHYFDASGTELSSPLPNPFTSETQTISVQVINPLNTTCIATSTIDFVVNPLPDFVVTTPQIICVTDPASVITLKVYQQNPAEILDYEWKDSSGLILSTNKTIDVTKPGTYFISLAKTDGSLCVRTKSIDVNPSEIATITQNDIVVKDDTNNNTITILTNNLGIGDYEFALDNDYGYQDEPFFDYVEAGIRTIFVRDKNDCGIAQIDVSVIGFPKFFTPNNDGFNDTWQVLGINNTLYPEAKIYIFDRFGKLLAQLSPDSLGWNGFFNGEQLPSTDYWFKVELIDNKGNSKIRSGHFSLIRK